MKQILRNCLYLIIVLLFLEVFKTIISKRDWNNAYFIGIVLASVQTLIILGFVMISLLWELFNRIVKQSRKSWLLSVLAFVIISGCLEWGCTILYHHPGRAPDFIRAAFDQYYNSFARSIIQFDKKASVYDPQLFYTLKPGARFRFSNAEFDNAFSVNRLGVRDDDSSLNKPAVICLGDSHAMGWGVDQDSTFCQQLEHLSGLRVLNTGVSSYGTAREIAALHKFDTSGLAYLLVQYCDNDFEENSAYIKNNYILKVSSQQEYDKTVRSVDLLSGYYPGKHFLNVSQLVVKRSINKVFPVFSFSGSPSAVMTDSSQARLFLDILSHAPVNFETCKVILLYPGNNFSHIRAFEKITDSLLQQPPYKALFGNNVRMLKVSELELVQPDDYYILDNHMRSSGHRKIAQGIWKMMQAF